MLTDREKRLSTWTKGLTRVSSIAAVLSAAAIGALAIVVALSFIVRSVFGTSIPGLIEFGESLMVLAVFLGLPYGEHLQSQIRMTLVTDALPPRVATVLRAVAMLVCAVLIAIFAYQTSVAAWNSYVLGEVRFGLLRFPLWPARMLIAVGFWLLLVQYVTKALLYLNDLAKREYARYDDGVRTPYTGGHRVPPNGTISGG